MSEKYRHKFKILWRGEKRDCWKINGMRHDSVRQTNANVASSSDYQLPKLFIVNPITARGDRSRGRTRSYQVKNCPALRNSKGRPSSEISLWCSCWNCWVTINYTGKQMWPRLLMDQSSVVGDASHAEDLYSISILVKYLFEISRDIKL